MAPSPLVKPAGTVTMATTTLLFNANFITPTLTQTQKLTTLVTPTAALTSFTSGGGGGGCDGGDDGKITTTTTTTTTITTTPTSTTSTSTSTLSTATTTTISSTNVTTTATAITTTNTNTTTSTTASRNGVLESDVTEQPLELITSSALLATTRLTSAPTLDKAREHAAGKRCQESQANDLSRVTLEPAIDTSSASTAAAVTVGGGSRCVAGGSVREGCDSDADDDDDDDDDDYNDNDDDDEDYEDDTRSRNSAAVRRSVVGGSGGVGGSSGGGDERTCPDGGDGGGGGDGGDVVIIRRVVGVSCCYKGEMDCPRDSRRERGGGGGGIGGGERMYRGRGVSHTQHSDTKIYTGSSEDIVVSNHAIHRTSCNIDVSNNTGAIYMASNVNATSTTTTTTSNTTTTAAAATTITTTTCSTTTTTTTSTTTTTTATDSDIYTTSIVGSDNKENEEENEEIHTDKETDRHVLHGAFNHCSSKDKRFSQNFNSTRFVGNTNQRTIKLQQPPQHHKCRQSEVPQDHSNTNTNTNISTTTTTTIKTTHYVQQQQQHQHQLLQHHVNKTTLLKATSYSMNPLPTLTVICLLLFTLIGSTYASLCPNSCYCSDAMNLIACAKKNFTKIPDLIPSDTKQLSLNGNIFSNKVLVRKNFSRLSALEDLFLNECGIEVITLDTFADLRRLGMLDLSNNRLSYIEDYTFRGLSLKHLFLNSNPGIQFAPKAFTGFRTIGLHLKKCGLHNLSLEEIRPLNGTVNIIWLNNNNFKYLSEEWYYLLKNFEHVRLENNPMHCNCELTWLYRMFINNSNLFSKDELMSCGSPRRLKSKTFDMLTVEDFQCQLPIFEGVDVLVGPHVGKLSCRAKADPSPTLYWHKPGGLTETFLPSKDRTIKTNRAVLYIHNHHTSVSSHYQCVANSPAGNVTFNLQVTWPQREPDNKNIITTPPTESSLPKSHGRSSNHTSMKMGDITVDVLFTLMELIGAVIGTFLLTFLLCLLIFHFFGRQPRPMGPQEKDHSEKRRTPENHYVMADIDESSIKMMEHKDLVS
ncbi:uncharacterized protein LOC106869296 [Argonauta hians]